MAPGNAAALASRVLQGLQLGNAGDSKPVAPVLAAGISLPHHHNAAAVSDNEQHSSAHAAGQRCTSEGRSDAASWRGDCLVILIQ